VLRAFASWLKANSATVEFFEEQFLESGGVD
jgi:hypothetical protein